MASKTRLNASPGDKGRPTEAKLFSTINSNAKFFKDFQCGDQACKSRRIRKIITEDCNPAARAPNLKKQVEKMVKTAKVIIRIKVRLQGVHKKWYNIEIVIVILVGFFGQTLISYCKFLMSSKIGKTGESMKNFFSVFFMNKREKFCPK